MVHFRYSLSWLSNSLYPDPTSFLGRTQSLFPEGRWSKRQTPQGQTGNQTPGSPVKKPGRPYEIGSATGK
ncbi:hypothetical protein RRF57_005522 [Xylaria bambusicola]|uniref:Uncharacterized protein n=1 Tax=Xylaria bambusicola TaxID=326684 RepID=A0AAN7Z4V3_9PEZI